MHLGDAMQSAATAPRPPCPALHHALRLQCPIAGDQKSWKMRSLHEPIHQPPRTPLRASAPVVPPTPHPRASPPSARLPPPAIVLVPVNPLTLSPADRAHRVPLPADIPRAAAPSAPLPRAPTAAA